MVFALISFRLNFGTPLTSDKIRMKTIALEGNAIHFVSFSVCVYLFFFFVFMLEVVRVLRPAGCCVVVKLEMELLKQASDQPPSSRRTKNE